MTLQSKSKILQRVLFVLLGSTTVVIIAAIIIVPRLNRYQVDGEITLSGPLQEITIVRDEKGMPYIYAGSMHDALFGHGFVTAQDRLFQIQLIRMRAQGRLTELAGEAARSVDVTTRTIGLHRLARKQAGILDAENRQLFQAFVDGINAFLENCPDDVPLEFSLAGLKPERWSIEDSLSILYLMSWDSSANLNHEIILQMLLEKLGKERASQLLPLNVNADAPIDESAAARLPEQLISKLHLNADAALQAFLTHGPLQVGSNNWAVSAALGGGGRAIVAGDPHLDPRMLPGPMYAVGYVFPGARAVGAGVPGIPGFIIGRNEYIATAVTNNYGDVQDLYVETIDPNSPDRYLDGGRSLFFSVETEVLKIKDDSASGGFREEKILIRSTKRGPVVSDVLPKLRTDKVLTLRWAAAEAMGGNIGITDLLQAKSVEEVHKFVGSLTSVVLNFVFADVDGNIGWRVSGRIPVRHVGGPLPLAIDPDAPSQDNWAGWIPYRQMPHATNPERGWLGTANHCTVLPDYPYYYSNYAAPSYRYRRLMERIDAETDGLTVDEHWSIQRDQKNLMAQSVAPVLAKALKKFDDTRELGELLSRWNYEDAPDRAEPTIFQTVYGQFARDVFQDELGVELTETMLGNWYFWQERFEQMVLDGTADWFDDVTTEDLTESITDVIHRAGVVAKSKLTKQLGPNPQQWLWRRVHTIQFANPIRRNGLGRDWLGTGPLPVGGSGETLDRGWYDFDAPFGVTHAAAARMVVDFADSDKVRAVLAGGTTGRTFHPHQKDQVTAYVLGKPLLHWWFSETAIQQHAVSHLTLLPEGTAPP